MDGHRQYRGPTFSGCLPGACRLNAEQARPGRLWADRAVRPGRRRPRSHRTSGNRAEHDDGARALHVDQRIEVRLLGDAVGRHRAVRHSRRRRRSHWTRTISEVRDLRGARRCCGLRLRGARWGGARGDGQAEDRGQSCSGAEAILVVLLDARQGRAGRGECCKATRAYPQRVVYAEDAEGTNLARRRSRIPPPFVLSVEARVDSWGCRRYRSSSGEVPSCPGRTRMATARAVKSTPGLMKPRSSGDTRPGLCLVA